MKLCWTPLRQRFWPVIVTLAPTVGTIALQDTPCLVLGLRPATLALTTSAAISALITSAATLALTTSAETIPPPTAAIPSRILAVLPRLRPSPRR